MYNSEALPYQFYLWHSVFLGRRGETQVLVFVFTSLFVRFLCKLLKHVHTKINPKGWINSVWIYEIINFPKNDSKSLKDFCPMYDKNSQGRNPSKFLGLLGKLMIS